jgi:hypothetical protein
LRLIRSFSGLCFVMVPSPYAKALFTLGYSLSLTRGYTSEKLMSKFP